eukprot:COSAG01_NODE_747_length_13858_cov_8.394869_4_plen_170_part_00
MNRSQRQIAVCSVHSAAHRLSTRANRPGGSGWWKSQRRPIVGGVKTERLRQRREGWVLVDLQRRRLARVLEQHGLRLFERHSDLLRVGGVDLDLGGRKPDAARHDQFVLLGDRGVVLDIAGCAAADLEKHAVTTAAEKYRACSYTEVGCRAAKCPPYVGLELVYLCLPL